MPTCVHTEHLYDAHLGQRTGIFTQTAQVWSAETALLCAQSLDAHSLQVFRVTKSVVVTISQATVNCTLISRVGMCRHRTDPQPCTMQQPMGMPRQWRLWWMPPPVTAMCKTPMATLLCIWLPLRVLLPLLPSSPTLLLPGEPCLYLHPCFCF